MTKGLRISAILLPFLALAACAPKQPQPDPLAILKDQVVTLQRQLLELQKQQNETRTKLDDSAALIGTLQSRVQTIEEKRSVPAARAVEEKQVTAEKKKPAKQPAKKKKKTRR